MTGKKRHLLLLASILVIGFLVRAYHVGSESVWYDEGASMIMAGMNVQEIFHHPENNPPLYYIGLHFWVKIFGNSEAAVRFPSVLFGSLSVLFAYLIGRRLFDRNTGLMTALILALSLFHVAFSQEARTYSLTVFLTLLSMFFFLRLMRGDSRKDRVGYVISSSLLLYSHVYAIFILLVQNLAYAATALFARRKDGPGPGMWVLLQGALAVFFIPWLNIFVTQTLNAVRQGTSLRVPTPMTVIETFLTFSGSGLLFLLLLLFAALSLVTIERARGKIDLKNLLSSIEGLSFKVGFSEPGKTLFLFAWLLTPIMLPILISRFLTPVYHYRYAIVGLPAFSLMAARGIGSITYTRLRALAIGVFVLVSFVYLALFYSGQRKEPWREVSRFVDDHALSNDLILFNEQMCPKFLFNYYTRRTDLNKRGFPEKVWQMGEEQVKELRPLVQGYERVWLILSYSSDKQSLIIKTLNESFALSSVRKFPSIDIYLFEKKPIQLLRSGHDTQELIAEASSLLCVNHERRVKEIPQLSMRPLPSRG